MTALATPDRLTFGRPAQPARPPRFQLAGHDVTQEMYYAAQNAKRGGRKVWLILAEDGAALDPLGRIRGVGADDCPNCEGYGQFMLDIAAAGPFKDHPGAVIADAKKGALPQSATYKAGAWWRVVRQIYPCPICAKTREVVL